MKDRTPESQVIIFDLDDTLYKEVDFVMSAYHHIDRLLVAEHDTKPGKAFRILRDSFKAGVNPFDTLSAWLDKEGISIPDAVQWMVDEYRNHRPMLKLDDNTTNALMFLAEMNVPMFIITDGRSFTQRNKIRALGIDEFIPWNNVFISEEIGFDKTNPYAFNEIKKRFADNAAIEYMFVGDNPAKDFLVANTNGALSVLLLDNGKNIHPQDIKVDQKHKAKFYIKQLQELNDYVADALYF